MLTLLKVKAVICRLVYIKSRIQLLHLEAIHFNKNASSLTVNTVGQVDLASLTLILLA